MELRRGSGRGCVTGGRSARRWSRSDGTDVARASAQDLARIWSRALWAHDTKPDGLLYDPRLNGETNVVVFDRALPKLVTVAVPRLVDCRDDLATILTDLDLAIV